MRFIKLTDHTDNSQILVNVDLIATLETGDFGGTVVSAVCNRVYVNESVTQITEMILALDNSTSTKHNVLY